MTMSFALAPGLRLLRERDLSGLTPLVRGWRWKASHRRLPAEVMRQPDRLPQGFPLPPDRPGLASGWLPAGDGLFAGDRRQVRAAAQGGMG
jgi:hypothetical protein